ncbi:hypothetical protein VKT23_019975 [Stygiomarasmius scandens]|uniref:Uncharacterized protein n=1 Tax=Marasmiellus scandens TaxID=2682957 RepID=A0ABR1INU3_9AGAR
MPAYKFSRTLAPTTNVSGNTQVLEKVNISYSKDGRYLAVLIGKQLTIWDGHTYDTQVVLTKQNSEIISFIWLSVDPHTLITAGIHESRFLAESVEIEWFSTNRAVNVIAANSSGTLLAFATQDTVEIWRRNPSNRTSTMRLGFLPACPSIGGMAVPSKIVKLHFLQGSQLLVAYGDGAIITWEVPIHTPNLAQLVDAVQIQGSLLQDISPAFDAVAVAEASSYKTYPLYHSVPD